MGALYKIDDPHTNKDSERECENFREALQRNIVYFSNNRVYLTESRCPLEEGANMKDKLTLAIHPQKPLEGKVLEGRKGPRGDLLERSDRREDGETRSRLPKL